MTALRQRYIGDLRLRNKSPRTIETYVLRVSLFARHFGRSPELLGPEQVRAYQEHLIARQVSWSTFNQAVCALRFLYQVTLGRPELIAHLPFARRPRKLPTVLSPEEVLRLLKAALPGRDRALLQTTYACGLRLQELLGLQVADIDKLPAWCCTSATARDRRNASCRCRRVCWRYCGITGGSADRRPGCFPV